MKKIVQLVILFLFYNHGAAQACFSNAVPFNFGNAPKAIVTGDFNNDGKLDLAEYNYDNYATDRGIVVSFGNGLGNFATPTAATTTIITNLIGAMAAGDFNNDGKLDIVAMISGTTPRLLFGNGAGQFTGGNDSVFPTLEGNGLTVGYFNSDAYLDLAVSDSRQIWIAFSNGTGFDSTTKNIPIPVGLSGNINTGKGALVTADFDNDGHYDFAVSNADDSSFSVLMNDGTNNFPFVTNYQLEADSSFDRALKIGDFNGDGKIDLLTDRVANLIGTSFRGIKVYLGDGLGGFPTIVQTSTLLYSDYVINDYDGDSILDVASNDHTYMSILKGNGDGSFGNPVSFTTSQYASAYFIFNNFVGGDFNNDGRIDIATANYNNTTNGQKVSVFLNQTNRVLTTAANSRCGSGTVTLAATTNSGSTLRWYDAASGGAILATGTSFTTPSLSATTSYFVEAYNATCTSPRVEVLATINPNITPLFTPIAPVCLGATLAALPVDSNNGIHGTWSPAIDNTATTVYTFTPAAGQCATSTTMTITINPLLTPTFTQVAPICYGATLSALPVDSNNGINGTWSPAINTTATTLYTFTPAAGQCAQATTMSIVINPLVAAPTGNSNQTFCSGETVGNIVVAGNSVVWYNAPTLGTIIPNSTALISGTTYYASQTISSCQSNSRLAVTVTNGTCLANENFEKLDVSVYPNPVTDYLNLTTDKIISKIEVYNMLGQAVLVKYLNTKEARLDLSQLMSGTYLIKLWSNNGVKTSKVFKQ